MFADNTAIVELRASSTATIPASMMSTRDNHPAQVLNHGTHGRTDGPARGLCLFSWGAVCVRSDATVSQL